MEILQSQVLPACQENDTFHRRLNGQGAACHSLNFKWFENAEAGTVQLVICFRKPKVYWTDKESNGSGWVLFKYNQT